MNDAISVPAPTQDEKTMAMLAHILQIFTWWIGPLVIFLVKQDSKFVRFHALQALLCASDRLVRRDGSHLDGFHGSLSFQHTVRHLVRD